MLGTLEHNRILPNGKDGPATPARPSIGLGDTNPTATIGSTFGAGAPLIAGIGGIGRSRLLKELLESLTDPVFVVQAVGGADLYVRSPEGVLVVETKVTPKPAGQVVLFQKVMQDWGFSEHEAAILLGFEEASDVREIFGGRKPIGHRDANDRLRTALRIAADLDALFQEIRAIRDWLNEPQKDLGGRTPRSLLNEGSMEALLELKDYVSYLSGR